MRVGRDCLTRVKDILIHFSLRYSEKITLYKYVSDKNVILLSNLTAQLRDIYVVGEFGVGVPKKSKPHYVID